MPDSTLVHFVYFLTSAIHCVGRYAVLGGLLLALPLTGAGQVHSTIAGRVAEADGSAIGFATVTLHRAADSAMVKAEFASEQGAFRLEATVGERYLVSAVQVGFKRTWSPAFELPATGLGIAPLALAHSTNIALKEVSVTANRPVFERLADRTVVHVEGTTLAAGATTLDVLGRAPGMTVDAADNLALRGRQGLLVVLDGKRLALSGPELAELLRALPAEQVKSIELITNPPANYDAQGGAGVIAINLKKDQRLGTNGSANASYGRGEFGKFTGGGALNYRNKKINAFGNYAYANRFGFLRVDLQRRFTPAGAPANSSTQADDQDNHLQSHALKAGLDYTLSAHTLLGVAVSGLVSQTTYLTHNRTNTYDDGGQATSSYHSITDQHVRRPNGSLNLNLRHTYADSAGAPLLVADADYARYDTHRLTDLVTNYDQPTAAPTLLTGDQQSTLAIESAKVDYSRPLAHRTRLEMGAKVSDIRSNNYVVFDRTQGSVTTQDLTISNEFHYRENVNAAYVTLSRTLPRATLQAGLRSEQTNTLGFQAADTGRFERHYCQLFPSASGQYTFNERHALALALNRRIERPPYNQVNPLRNYIDATSYGSGNPNLGPATSYNVELTHTYHQKFTTSLSYGRTNQPIVLVVQASPDGNHLVVNKYVNLAIQHYYALTLTVPLAPTPWWSFYGDAVLSYNQFAGTLAATMPHNTRPALALTTSNTFTLSHGWSGELNGKFESGEVYGFENLRARGQLALGLQKSLLAKQGTLRLAVADVFYTNTTHSAQMFTNFSESYFMRQDTRVATLAFTYRFGSAKVAGARKRALGAEEEMRRAGGQ